LAASFFVSTACAAFIGEAFDAARDTSLLKLAFYFTSTIVTPLPTNLFASLLKS